MTTRSEYWENKDRSGPALSDGQFNLLRRCVELLLPAIGAFYFAMAELWGWPNPGEVVASIAALTTLLGVVLVVLRNSYEKSDARYDGDLVVNTSDPEKDRVRLEVGVPLDDIPSRDEIVFRVRNES